MHEQQPSAEKQPPKRWRRGLGAVGLVAAGAVIASPFAASQAITESEVRDVAGPVPGDVSLAPEFSQVATGVFGSIYNQDLIQNEIGVKFRITGLPDLAPSGDQEKSVQIQQTLDTVTGFYANPNEVTDAYGDVIVEEAKNNFLRNELIGGLAIAGLIGASYTFGKSKNKKWLATGAAAAAATVGSLGLSYADIHDWKQANQMPETTYELDVFNGSRLENSVTDEAATATTINSYKDIYQEQLRREQLANQEFIDNAYRTLEEQIEQGRVDAPEADQTMVLSLSDLHANRDMIKVWQHVVDKINAKYGEETIEVVLLGGDSTYGSVLGASAVESIAKISDGDKTIGINGNHDTATTNQQKQDAGVEVLDGEIAEADDLSILGYPDPELTTISALLTSGDNISRDGSGKTQLDVGQMMKQKADDTNPDIIISPEAYTVGPLLGIDQKDITYRGIDQWFAAGSDDSGFLPDNVADVPTSLVTWGNWHRPTTRSQLHDGLRYRVISNSDGTWSVAAELGSAGGASPSMRPANMSLPYTTPAQLATGELITFNNDSDLVVRMQNINVNPHGQAEIMEAIKIGAKDGLAYGHDDDAADKPGQPDNKAAVRPSDKAREAKPSSGANTD